MAPSIASWTALSAWDNPLIEDLQAVLEITLLKFAQTENPWPDTKKSEIVLSTAEQLHEVEHLLLFVRNSVS